MSKKIICVVGPTASGKSDLAQSIAVELGGNIISADSMQVYKGMDIGTAKVPECDREVPHFGLDLVNPGEAYSAALFQSYARDLITDFNEKGIRTILVGGTGFYIRSVIDDYEFAEGSQVDNPIRDRYNHMLVLKGPESVWDELYHLDSESANVINPNDSKRVIRALEMHHVGDSYAKRLSNLQAIDEFLPSIMIGIDVDRQLLRRRIDERTDSMFDEGLIDEVKNLIDNGFRDGVTAPSAIGYKEIVDAIDGNITFEEARERIATATKRYAKRQMTWFRKDERINWIEYSDDKNEMLRLAMEVIDRNDD